MVSINTNLHEATTIDQKPLSAGPSDEGPPGCEMNELTVSSILRIHKSGILAFTSFYSCILYAVSWFLNGVICMQDTGPSDPGLTVT